MTRISLGKFLGWLRFIPLGAGIMFGLLGGAREVVVLFLEHPDPVWQKKVFWACVWIASFIALVIAWIQKNQELLAEQAKNAEPKLAGRIDCLDHDVAWDLENFGLDEEMPMKIKVTFALNISLWNETPAHPTTVSGFVLWLLWEGGQDQAAKLPVENYLVLCTFPRSEPLEWGYEVKPEPLVAFPNNVEIGHNHVKGWLRFLARQIPAEASENAILRKDVTWKLCAYDRKGHEHKIYEGTWDLSPCGSIERNDKFIWAA